LASLSRSVTLEVWQRIVDRAVADAIKGDAQARAWLSKYLLGTEPTGLVKLAALERAGISPDQQIDTIAVRKAIEAVATQPSWRERVVAMYARGNVMTSDGDEGGR
jgi:hypothetical protein